jgi:hypothetical protein
MFSLFIRCLALTLVSAERFGSRIVGVRVPGGRSWVSVGMVSVLLAASMLVALPASAGGGVNVSGAVEVG